MYQTMHLSKTKLKVLLPNLLKLVPKFNSTENNTAISIHCVDT